MLAIRQINKSRDKLLGQGMAILLRKSADQEDGALASQRTILPELEFRFISKREGIRLVISSFLVQESFVLTTFHVGLVTMFL